MATFMLAFSMMNIIVITIIKYFNNCYIEIHTDIKVGQTVFLLIFCSNFNQVLDKHRN